MKVWKTVEPDNVAAGDISRRHQIPVPAAGVLCRLGLREAEEIEYFLDPRLNDLSDPFLLPSMAPAARRIWRAIDTGESIAVYGDYDVDGIAGTGLLTSVLLELGARRVAPFLPDRLSDGYGLGVEALHKCIADCDPSLVVTVDCGTDAVEAVSAAASMGVDVIVTDHHETSGESCGALAVVNPKLGSVGHLKALAGVGVVFKLCHALVKIGRKESRCHARETDLRNYLDWVALGTVADLVPMLAENRILVRHGLSQLNRTKNTGLRALKAAARISDRIDTYHVGYMLAPRLNAAGRLGRADAALDLLMTDDDGRASDLAMQLDRANRDRQKVEAGILNEALSEIDSWFDPSRHFGIVVGKEGWHQGVVGIVASRLAGKYRRPAVVVGFDADGVGRGSSRSIEGYPLLDGLGECGEFLAKFGGHDMAAGIEVRSDQFEGFRSAFERVAAGRLKGRDLRAVQRVDAWIGLGEANAALLECFERFKPFGQDNPAPVFAARGLRVKGSPRKAGRNHLCMTLVSDGAERRAIAFGMAGKPLPQEPFEAAFGLERAMYGRNGHPQLRIHDIRASGPVG